MFTVQSSDDERSSTVRRITMIVGGCKSANYNHLTLLHSDYVFGADVEAELPDDDSVRAQHRHVVLFKLAAGQTADTLFADASPTTREIVRGLAGMAAANGLGQLRGVGAKAALQLVQSEEWQRAKRELINEVLIACNGTVPHLIVEIKGSVAGGVGSGAMAILAHDLVMSLAEALGTNVHLQFDATGMITFLSLGERIEKNTAAGLADLTAYVTRKESDSRITKSLSLVEYPPCRRAKSTRDGYVLLDEQALASGDVQRILNRIVPNEALSGALGNVTLRKVDWFTSLDPVLIAKVVADSYAAALQQILEHAVPNPQSVDEVQLNEHVNEMPRENVAEIACQALNAEYDELDSLITQPGEIVQVDPVVKLASMQSFRVADTPSHWALAPHTPEDALQRLIVQGAVADALRDRIAILQDQRFDIEEVLDGHRGKLKSTHAAIRRTRFTDRLRGLLTSLDSKLNAFEDTAADLRAAADQLHSVNSKLESLQFGLRCVEAEIDHLRGHILSIIDILRQHSRPTIDGIANPPVTVKPLSTVWRDVWTLPSRNREERATAVASCVAGVTIQGLALITGALPPRLEAIADRIAYGQVATNGPPWAGQPRTDQGVVIYVVPPIEPMVAQRLCRLIVERNPDVLVATADTASAGVNVVRLTFHWIRSVDELYPTLLRQKLVEAQQDPLSPLFLPFGEEALNLLGLHNGEAESSNAAHE